MGQSEFTEDIELTGRNVEVVTFFNAMAITDTTVKSSGLIDLSKYRNIQVIAFSTLNQNVDIFFSPNRTTSALVWDGTQFIGNARKETLNASYPGQTYVINSRFEWLNNALDKLQISAQCPIAPISGSLTVLVLGVPN